MAELIIKRDYFPGNEWEKKQPEVLGMKTEKLSELEKIIKIRFKNINGIMVVRKGFSVFEKYYNGYGINDAHNTASVTKSVISALIGIAIEKGFIRSIDDKVIDFFPEYNSIFNIKKQTIKIRHILTMTAPFAWNSLNKRNSEPLDRLRRQNDWLKYILEQMGENGTPGMFQYSTGGIHLLSAIISRTTGKSAREFANEELFTPIGMQEIQRSEMKSFKQEDVFGEDIRGWINDPSGINAGGWGLALTIRDMARFGFLYLNKGIWKEKRIISERWIEESVKMNVNNYGYLWWLDNKNGLFSFSALGSGGNMICCVPEKELVVSVAAKVSGKGTDSREIVENYIIPSIS